MTKEKLRICFGGDDEIELTTLTKSLQSTVNCLSTIADNTISKEDFCKFYVNNVTRGSFTIDIAIVKEIAVALAPVACQIALIFIEIWKIRKELRGEKPKSIKKNQDNTVEITGCNGNKISVEQNTYNLYIQTNDLEKECANISEIITKDNKRTTLSIEKVDAESGQVLDAVEFDREELAILSMPVDVESLSSEIEESINQVWLRVKKGDFVGNTKWEFITPIDGKTIVATIEDNDFIQRIRNSRTGIFADTKLLCDLRCRARKDENGQYSKQTYSVLKVIKEVQPPQQMGIDDI